VLATTRYGAIEFPAMVRRGNVMAAQFHPEKSHRRGLALLARFVELT
jgi:imidazole glycerol-phosphate synthase subunit HisH